MRVLKLLIIFCLFLKPNILFAQNIDEMIGQMIIVGFQGSSINHKGFREVKSKLKSGDIGGIIFFKHNITNPKNLRYMISSLKKVDYKYTPLISIDQEGGKVQRMDKTNGFKDFPSFRNVSNTYGVEKSKGVYAEMANMLSKYSFNVNFSPCVDLDLNENSIISQKQRSFSSDYKNVIKFSKIVIEEHEKRSIITVLKHFPGHGSAMGDTHLGFVDSTPNWCLDEIKPYKTLINYTLLQMVMVGHTFNAYFDEEFPSSLSKKTINGILREKLSYSGVVITDDLDMKAIKSNYTLEQTVIGAINAGVDILLFSNCDEKADKHLVSRIHKIIKKGIKEGKISKEDIEKSYKRIIKLKSMLK